MVQEEGEVRMRFALGKGGMDARVTTSAILLGLLHSLKYGDMGYKYRAAGYNLYAM